MWKEVEVSGESFDPRELKLFAVRLKVRAWINLLFAATDKREMMQA